MPVSRFFLAAALGFMTVAGVADAQTSAYRATQVLRIRLMPTTAIPTPQPFEWKESRGPKCIPRGGITAAIVSAPKDIDFIMRDRTRHRARLKRSCPALQYYAGFYLKPTPDGFICRDRDVVHDRSGSECEIDAFRKLTAEPVR